MKQIINRNYVKKFLHYDPDTGHFTWLKDRGRGVYAGDRAGSAGPHGYRQIKFFGVAYREHRLVWLYMTGNWPKDQIDHINRVRDDNRWCNLRDVSNTENQRNSYHKIGKSGIRGVRQVKDKFVASARLGDDLVYLGIFRHQHDAIYAIAHASKTYDDGMKNSHLSDYILGQM